MAGPKKKLSTKGFTSGEKATRLNKTLSQFKSYKIPPMPKGVGGASLAEKMVAGGMKTMNSTPNFSKTSNKTMKKVLGFAPGEKLSRVSTVLKSPLAKKVPYVGAALSAVSIGKSVAKIVKNRMGMKPIKGSKNYKAPKNTKKLKKPQNTRKDPMLDTPKGGNLGDKRAARHYINKDNKMIGKAKKYIEKNPRKMPDAAEDAIEQSRNYIEFTKSNFSSKARKTVTKSRKR